MRLSKAIFYALIGLLVWSLLCPVNHTTLQAAKAKESFFEAPTFRKAIKVPMRDGKFLAADLYTSNISIQKPVILIQTPYNKQHYWANLENKIPFQTKDYHIVVIDWRGRFSSTKADVSKPNIGEDGYDSVEWIADQPWSNGKIGTYGGSALAQVQFKTAKEQPQHLVCAIPMVKDFRTTYSSYYFGGEFRKEHVAALESLGFVATDIILSNPTYNNMWKYVENKSDLSSSINVPMLLIGGWFDHFPDLVLNAFSDLQNNSEHSVRQKHKLIFGPWMHSGIGKLDQGCLSFPNAEAFAQKNAVQFMDFYLLNKNNNWEEKSSVQYYQMGEEKWHSAETWDKIPRSNIDLYFQPNFSLLNEKPKEQNYLKTYNYDPNNPTPSYGGNRFQPFNKNLIDGPQDQRSNVESREDVLVYTSEELIESFAINGSIEATLYIKSSRPDTDFSIRFCDVYPDGKSILLAEGIQRARFRNSLEKQEFLEPGQIYPVNVQVQNIAHTVLPGHKIRIIVSSASYPIFEKNPNNGGTLYKDTKTYIAENSVFTCKQYPSKVSFQTLQ